MSTVFQFGQAQFVKDLIFGWCFRADDSNEWTKLSDFPTDVLKELSTATFPSYVPDDLRKTILGELERRQVQERQARECGAIVADAWKEYDKRLTTAEETANRQGDRIKLMEAIINSMKIDGEFISPDLEHAPINYVSADLDYVKISHVGEQWVIRGDWDTEHEYFNSIGDAVSRILARWW